MPSATATENTRTKLLNRRTQVESFEQMFVPDYETVAGKYPRNLPSRAMRFDSIDELKDFVTECGNQFFDPKMVDWHGLRVSKRMHGGRFIVTSERPKRGTTARRYTVRYVTGEPVMGARGYASVNDFGIGIFKTDPEAHAFAEQAAQILFGG